MSSRFIYTQLGSNKPSRPRILLMKLSLMPTWTCSSPTRVHWCPADDAEDPRDGLKALWMIEKPLIGWRNINDPFCGHLPFDRVLEPLEMVLGHEEDLVPTYIVVWWCGGHTCLLLTMTLIPLMRSWSPWRWAYDHLAYGTLSLVPWWIPSGLMQPLMVVVIWYRTWS